MEKLSSIIPKNSRVSSVDLASAPPVRPGAISFGQKEGSSEIRDRVTKSALSKTKVLESLQTYRNPREAARAKIAEDVSRRFFSSRQSEVVPEPEEAGPSAADLAQNYLANEPQAKSFSPTENDFLEEYELPKAYDVRETSPQTYGEKNNGEGIDRFA